jgi:hypothetical protein
MEGPLSRGQRWRLTAQSTRTCGEAPCNACAGGRAPVTGNVRHTNNPCWRKLRIVVATMTEVVDKRPAIAPLCVFCGKLPAKTKDHIPPKGIFPKPRPELITVPACLRCNRGTSRIEETFRVYLSLRVGVNNDATSNLWNNEAMRTLRHNPRLRNRIIRSTRPISVRSPAGIILADRIGGLWPPEAHDPVIEKIIRGLYFYHYREILGARVEIKIHWLRTSEDLESWTRRIDSSLEQLWTELPGAGNVGTGYFRYRYARAIESPLHSTWLFDFYGAHFAGGYTSPVDARTLIEGIPNGSL